MHRQRYTIREEAKRDTFEYVEVFYNWRRRHSALDYQNPAAFANHFKKGCHAFRVDC